MGDADPYGGDGEPAVYREYTLVLMDPDVARHCRFTPRPPPAGAFSPASPRSAEFARFRLEDGETGAPWQIPHSYIFRFHDQTLRPP